jgi:hypothetical protein
MTDDAAIATLRGFAEALERAPFAALEAASIALNEGAQLAESLGRSTILQRLNLDAPYVHKHLRLDKESTRTDLMARVRATKRSVLAPRYGAEVATQPAVSVGRNFERLKGDPGRGIPKGMKAAGSSPWSALRSGEKKAWRNAFFIKLKGSGAWGMVARMGRQGGLDTKSDWDQNLKVVFALSVDQAWKGVRDEVSPQAMEHASAVFEKEFAGRL